MSCAITAAAVVLSALSLIAAWVAWRSRDAEGWLVFVAYAAVAGLCWAVAWVLA